MCIHYINHEKQGLVGEPRHFRHMLVSYCFLLVLVCFYTDYIPT